MTDPVARDDHLLKALRHAPDADVGPPSALSEAIRRQARDALTPPRASGAWRRWFAAPVAPWATGFAGIVVATTVALIWNLEPVPERPEPAPPVPSTAAIEQEVRVESRVQALPESNAAAKAVPAEPLPGQRAELPAAQRQGSKENKLVQPAAPAPAPMTAPTTRAAPKQEAADRLETEPPRTPIAGGRDERDANVYRDQNERRAEIAPPAAQARGDVAFAESAAVGRTKPAAKAAADSTGAEASAAATPVEPLQPSAPTGGVASQRARSELAAVARNGAPPLALQLTAPDADTSRAWRLRSGVEPVEHEFDAMARGWFSRLLAITAGRWVAGPKAWPATGRELQIVEGGRPVAILRLTDDGLHWRDEATGRTWYASLDAAQRDRLGWPW